MSLAEWAALPEDEPGELVDGQLVEEEMPTYIHERIVAWLILAVGTWGAQRGALVAGSGAKFAVAADRGRMPDVTIYLRGDRRPQPTGLIDAPPTIAIEIVSATPRDQRRDRIEKLEEYARFGIRWYWLVDPELRSFEIFERNADGRYVHLVGVSSGVIDPTPGCDGLALDVSALWAEVDELIAGQ